MKKVVMIPLDERPCNYNFPSQLPTGDVKIVLPPFELMGNKKIPGHVEQIHDWLLKEIVDADYAILAMDTLLYGGIVPSRLHEMDQEVLLKRLEIVRQVKKINPKIKLFGFELIMRCPWYSLSDEEPDYYETYGSEIHRYGRYKHLQLLNMMTNEDEADLKVILDKLDMDALADYEHRRTINLNVLMETLNLVKEGLFDFFIVPQDDAAVYGYTSIDQLKVRSFIKENYLQTKIPMYPSADDTGLILVGRVMNDVFNEIPNIYVYYASSKGAHVIPSFEDRIIDETIKHHIHALGARRVYSLLESDILLAVNIGSSMLNPNEPGYELAYHIERNLAEFVDQIKYAQSLGKLVAVADVAHANGGDIDLMKLLSNAQLTLKIDAYAGWNTSSNTIGTVLGQVASYMHTKDKVKNKQFLLSRYYEDVAYCTYTRKHITDNYLEKMGFNYFDVGQKNGEVAHLVNQTMNAFMKEHFHEIYQEVQSTTVEMPWRRMFEIDLDLKI